MLSKVISIRKIKPMRVVRPPMASYPAQAGEGAGVESFERVARGTGNGASPRQCGLPRVMPSPVPLGDRRLDAGESLVVLAVIPFVVVTAGFRQGSAAIAFTETGDITGPACQ